MVHKIVAGWEVLATHETEVVGIWYYCVLLMECLVVVVGEGLLWDFLFKLVISLIKGQGIM